MQDLYFAPRCRLAPSVRPKPPAESKVPMVYFTGWKSL